MVLTVITLATLPKVTANLAILDLYAVNVGSLHPMESVQLDTSVEVALRQINPMMQEQLELHVLLGIIARREQVLHN